MSNANQGIDDVTKEFLNLGIEETSKGEYESSINFLNDAISLIPKREWLHYERGRAKMELLNFAEARKDFAEEIEIDHSTESVARSYYETAKCYSFENKNYEAIQNFQKVLKIKTDDPVLSDAKRDLEQLKISLQQPYMSKVIYGKGKNDKIENLEEVLKISLDNKLKDLIPDDIIRHDKNFIKNFIKFFKDSKNYQGSDLENNPDFKKYLKSQIEELEKDFGEESKIRFSPSPVIAAICILIVAEIIGIIEARQPGDPESFRPEEEADKAVRGFARATLEGLYETEYLEPKEYEAILLLNQKQEGKNFFDEMLKAKTTEEYGKFLEKECSDLVTKDGTKANISKLKEILNNLFVALHGIQKTNTAGKNYIYDWILKADHPSKVQIDQNRLKKYIQVFSEEYVEHGKKFVSEVISKRKEEIRKGIEEEARAQSAASDAKNPSAERLMPERQNEQS